MRFVNYMLIFFVIAVCSLNSCTRSSSDLPSKALWDISDLEHALDAGHPVKIVDMQKAAEYQQKHIPSSVNITRDQLESKDYPYNGMLAPKMAIEDLLGKMGISSNDFILVYDAKGNVDAARLWWALNVYGHKKTALLNGGLQAWEKSKNQITKDIPSFSPVNYFFSGEGNPALMASKHEVTEYMKDTSAVILDVRSLPEFTGEVTKEYAFRPGHIPGCTHFDYINVLSEDQSFKTIRELKELYRSRGITPDKRIIVYCHSGVRSAHTLFTLTQLLGYKNVKNYDGSWIEWSYFKNLPAAATVNARL